MGKNEVVYDLTIQIQVQKRVTGNRIHIFLCMALPGEVAFRIGKANLSGTNHIRLWRHAVDCSCVGNWVERASVGRVAWFLFACFSFFINMMIGFHVHYFSLFCFLLRLLFLNPWLSWIEQKLDSSVCMCVCVCTIFLCERENAVVYKPLMDDKCADFADVINCINCK